MTNPIPKFREFLNEVVIELKKSAWPTRPELLQSTFLVLVSVIVLGLFVFSADALFAWIVNWLTGAA
jgi:preprotein translocase subunit SecE